MKIDWTWNRILSLVVVGFYLAVGMLNEGFSFAVLRVAIAMLLPLAFIWFGDEIGQYTGLSAQGLCVDKPSPGWMIIGLGWLFLLTPFLVPLICKLY